MRNTANWYNPITFGAKYKISCVRVYKRYIIHLSVHTTVMLSIACVLVQRMTPLVWVTGSLLHGHLGTMCIIMRLL